MLVTVGVETHTDVHVAAVLDPARRLLETRAFPATTRGYAQLATWAESFGQVDKVGMKGTGSFGAGLLRFLADYGLTVVEVDRPDRVGRRRNGKSDPLDAESAARAVRSGRPPEHPSPATPRCCPSLRMPMLAALRVPMSACVKSPAAVRLRGLVGVVPVVVGVVPGQVSVTSVTAERAACSSTMAFPAA